MITDQKNRKERDRLVREEDFLAAAERLFADKGFHQTSMEDIARVAEYGTGTIYRYFKSKTELYHELLNRKAVIYFDFVRDEVAKQKSPREKLHALFHSKVNFFRKHRAFMTIYFSEIVGQECNLSAGVSDKTREVHEKYQELVRQTLRAGIKKGVSPRTTRSFSSEHFARSVTMPS
ncbi:TetR/AcrR family transcriptional regulator [Oscillatoria laete-virens NRMC-F 0139]|nr:TetR/AcrR family transcriptional regulator [Oscillatoria laete-virens]MDL5053292.1 TetR/AcrR family transcriptional regulator [Oscillatoria laete-virens NRMC-F 0139]